MNKLLKKLFNKKYMSGGGNSNNLNIIILITIILLFLYVYHNNQTNKNIIQVPSTQISQNEQNNKQTENTKIGTYTKLKQPEKKKIIKIQGLQNQGQDYEQQLDLETIIPEIYPVLRDYDYRTLNDPLTPPYKRDDDMIPANVIAPDLFGIYTQGGPLPFIKVGKLIDNHAKNDEPYKFLILFGRRRYPGSNLYDYYATTTSRDDYLKFDLDYKNIRYELYTGNHVFIPELKKKYEVIIDRQMDFTYTPYM
jgi:hypothetical protein